MGIFKTAPKDYASIVSPLTQIEANLSEYIADQGNNIESIESEIEQLQSEIEVKKSDIKDSNMEILKSESTVVKIGQLLSYDLDENGINDVDEILPEVDQGDETLSEDDPEE